MSDPFTAYPMEKRTLQDMMIYLANATAINLSASQWGVTTWQAAHGEGRSASATTFHVGLRLAQGVYWTCILLRTRGRDVALSGTMRNWGNTAPNLAVVLQTYQREYKSKKSKAPVTEPAQQDPSDNNGGGGAGGSGGGNGNPPAWEKKVLKDDYGGHYYMDENDEYCACDPQGNQLKMNSTNGPTTNPYGILLVFMNSQRQPYLYARGQRIPCQPQQDPSTRRYFIVDDKRRKRNVQIYGSLPRWRAPRAQAPAQAPVQPSGKAPASKSTSSKTISSKTPGQAAKAPVQRQPLQAVQYMIDAASGRKYYIGADGHTHWA